MDLTTNYNPEEWLSTGQVADTGAVVNEDGTPYSQAWIQKLIKRQIEGGAVVFIRPDGHEQVIIKVPYMHTRYQFLIHRSAVESYEPYETYKAEIHPYVEEIEERLKDGEGAYQLANEYGLAPKSVYRLKDKLGIEDE